VDTFGGQGKGDIEMIVHEEGDVEFAGDRYKSLGCFEVGAFGSVFCAKLDSVGASTEDGSQRGIQVVGTEQTFVEDYI
jgi:hypothetical protein